jgi:CrcB protein
MGSALGGVARYGCAEWIGTHVNSTFPWGTLFVNVLGSLLIGIFAAMIGPEGRFPVSDELKYGVMIGFCGGYTTFSALSLQTLQLLQQGEFLKAAANILLSVTLCLAAVGLGYMLGK